MFFSLRNRLFVIFSCLLTIPFLILSIVIPSLFTAYIKDQTQELTVELMDQFSLYIDSIMTQAEDIGQQVLVSSITQEWISSEAELKDDAVFSTDRLLIRNELTSLLNSMMVNNSNDISVSIFLDNGTGVWGNYSNLEELEWYRDFINNNKIYTNSHMDTNQPYTIMQQIPINSHLIPLVDMNTLESYGIIKVNLSTKLIENATNKIKIGENGNTFIIDLNGSNVLTNKIKTPQKIIDHSLQDIRRNDNERGLIELEGYSEEYLMFYQKLAIGDWILISEVTENDLFAKSNQLQRNLLLLSIVVFILTIVASFIFSSSITDPLRQLTKAMKYLEKGDFYSASRFISTIKSENNEIRYVLNVFDHTVEQLKKLINNEYKANIRQRNAEYKALLLQINPHFLNNTLEIISGLAAQEKNQEVMRVSVNLGKMLRYSLNTKTNSITLGEEIDYIRNYINILQLRYEDDLIIHIDEGPGTQNLTIIKFIIQPIVENAVKYSLMDKNSAEVLIKTSRVENQLKIIIEDDGIGIPEHIIRKLRDKEQNVNQLSVLESEGNSIGLRNVLERLRLYYGEKFTYQIESEKNKGTNITLIIEYQGGE